MMGSCRADVTSAEGFASIVDKCKELEVSGYDSYLERVGFLDRLWLEQRRYNLEEEIEKRELHTLSSPSESLGRILGLHSDDSRCAGILVLGEADVCINMMQLSPFPTHARIPRAAEIFMMKWIYEGGWTREYLGTYTRNPEIVLFKSSSAP
jgi:hypothetical protein